MPVVIESINHPSAQDSRDLAKIYADAPAWLLPPYATAHRRREITHGEHSIAIPMECDACRRDVSRDHRVQLPL
jgi:hypothetical protein